MDANQPEQNDDLSLAMSRLEVAGSGGAEVAKKALNVKAIAILAGLAVAGGGITYVSQKKAGPGSAAVADSTAFLQQATAQAAGYDPAKESPYSSGGITPAGFTAPPGAAIDTSAEDRMRLLQAQAQGQPAGSGAPPPAQMQQQNQRGGGGYSGSRSSGGGGGSAIPSGPASILPAHLKIRLNSEYAQWLEMQGGPAVVYSRPDGASGITSASAVASGPSSGGVPGVDPALQNLYSGAQGYAAARPFYLPAGAEITCVTDHPINTDYAGAIRATVVAPADIKGAHVIVTHAGVNIDRATAQAGTLVVNRNGAWSQYALQGVVRTDLPALNGIVNHHYMRRIMPAVANAGIAGGALYLSSQNSNNNISTQDQIYNSMVVAGLNGVQAEIAKINDGKPELTVVVPAGQEFTILLTAGLEVK